MIFKASDAFTFIGMISKQDRKQQKNLQNQSNMIN